MDKRTDKKPAGFWRKNFPTLLYILCIPTKRWFLYCLGIFAILLCSDVTLAWWWRHVPISYQTTRITSPLRPDGTVDYIAALNQICGKDVTPDNNAVVDLLKAVGTNSIPDVVQADYLKLLGTQQTLLAQGKFESLDQFAREDKSYLSNVTPYDRKVQIDWLDDLDYDHALKTSEYPEVYKWIQSQQYSMALFKSASIRNYFYEPMVTSSPNGIGVPYIAFRNWTTGGKGGLFQKMFHFFQFRKDEFLAHYHRRSNIESTVMMIKSKFGDHVRSKTEVAARNEVLAKIVCHNICCLISAMYELGIEPMLTGEKSMSTV